MEDEVFGDALPAAEDNPPDPGKDEAVFVAGDVDGLDEGPAEVPRPVRDGEGRDEAAGGGVDVDAEVPAVGAVHLAERGGDPGHVLEVACGAGAEEGGGW